MKFLRSLAVVALAAQAIALSIGSKKSPVIERDSDGLQDVVTYDEHSLKVYGERIFIFSGEFHPARLPVPGLWLDIFQKVKALGFSAVSFYAHWSLLEGQPGHYLAEGVFDYEPFFAAAKEAGIYLIARPGPYINAESSGGGFPGWLQRIKGELRTRAPDYLSATNPYALGIGAAIAKAQITNGGPVILLQIENEYSGSEGVVTGGFPDPYYFEYIKNQFREAGVKIPFINNDVWAGGLFAPGDIINGTTVGDVDIYGHDSYPLGFNCAEPYTWPIDGIPTYFHASHEQESPSTPYLLTEFQGGSLDSWGGVGNDQCAILLNQEFERVLYKNNCASGAAILNLYMIFGGTNWGNLGYPGVYTSYDYGAAITENRELYREKYSELKLEANFLKVSPAYLTASVGAGLNGTYSDSQDIFITPLYGNGSATNFYVVRHADYQQEGSATYTVNLNTSVGTLSVPQLGGRLTLSGRDSKWHVTDYDLGGTTLLYSTAEIFTWKKFEKSTVLVIYGGPGELHELSVLSSSAATVVEGVGITTHRTGKATTINWKTQSTRRVVKIGDLLIYILDRNSAYNYWVPDFVRTDHWGAFTTSIDKTASVIIEAGYLIRSVSVKGSQLHISGDLNATVPLNILGAPSNTNKLYFNGEELAFSTNHITGEWSSTLRYNTPKISVPDLSSLSWKYLDDLPEIQSSYDDSAWTQADYTTSNNTAYSLLTPTSLFASDYGYNSGILIYRGWFIADGSESTFFVHTQGGSAFGSSVFLNSTYLGSWAGASWAADYNSTYTLPNLVAGKTYVVTILVDNNGLDENWTVGTATMKTPRGILNYSLSGRNQSVVTWKLTGNLRGESYVDKTRGPLNEGGLYAERQGFTQPNPPSHNWASRDPETGISKAGVAFYSTNFDLDFPKGYDIPMTFNFATTIIDGAVANYRAQLWVNGYQFGKYINNIGPQLSFPVPQGILNYHGENWLAVEIWSHQASGARLTNFQLEAGTPIQTSLDAPALAPAPSYSRREGAY